MSAQSIWFTQEEADLVYNALLDHQTERKLRYLEACMQTTDPDWRAELEKSFEKSQRIISSALRKMEAVYKLAPRVDSDGDG